MGNRKRQASVAAGDDGIIDPKRLPTSYSVARGLLSPLRYGKAVVLAVDDPTLFKKSRSTKPQLLLLTPLSIYGPPSKLLSIALPCYGCEIVDTSSTIKPIVLFRLGLGAALTKELVLQLNEVFSGENHGKKRT